jgi:hypothetical protein
MAQHILVADPLQESVERAANSLPAFSRNSSSRWAGWKLWLAALGISLLYLPFLNTGFDFADDGVLVYPKGVSSLPQFLEMIRISTLDDFKNHGPFRPTAWAFWRGQAELFHGDPFLWRLGRQLWIILSAAVLMLFLKELGIRLGVAALVTVLAIWNPFRAEIWLGLNFMEGTMMPFALGGLICATRASYAERPAGWDLCGFCCILLVVLSKNVFLAMIPAQLFLRVATPSRPLREGLRKHGMRALMLGVVALVPVVHFIFYKLNYRPGQYDVGLTAEQPLRLLRNMGVALAVDFLAPVLLLGIWLIGRSRREGSDLKLRDEWCGESPPFRHSFGSFPGPMRNALGVGVILFLAGLGVYLPVLGAAARYVVPGIWGLDVLLALFFTRLAFVPAGPWKRATYGLVVCALFALGLINLGKQTKFSARNELLWDVLLTLEEQGSSANPVGWVGVDFARKTGNLLEFGEGYHFAQHLRARGWEDLDFHLLDALNQEQTESFGDAPAAARDMRVPTRYLITGTAPAPDGAWILVADFQRPYWAGLRHYQCYLWKNDESVKNTE